MWMMMMTVYIQHMYMYMYMYICISVHTTHTSYTLSVITQEGYSALMLAASEGKTEAVVELVKAGANVDMQTKINDTVCQHIYIVHDVHCRSMYMYM